MKKLLFAVVAFAAVLTSCNMNQDKLDRQQQMIDSLAQANSLSAKEVQEYIEIVDAVSESLDYLNAAEGELQNAGKEGTPQARRAALQSKVTAMSNVVKEQRERIAELQKKLNASGGTNKKLQNVIDMLNSQLEQKEAEIAELQAQLADKNVKIEQLTANVNTLTESNTQLSNTVESQQETITSQTNQMNEAYVLVGTKSELKEKGILAGGFLKKTKVVPSNMDKSLFRQVDQRSFSTLNIPSKSPKVLSPIPADSYTITRNGDSSVLKVTDPSRFWSVSNFLIIQE